MNTQHSPVGCVRYLSMLVLFLAIGAGGCCHQEERRQIFLHTSEPITINVRNADSEPITIQSTDSSVPDKVLEPGGTLPVRFTVVEVLAMYELKSLLKDAADANRDEITVPEDLTKLEIVKEPATPFITDAAGATVKLPVRSTSGEDWTQVIELAPCLLGGHRDPFELSINGPPDLSGPVRLCDE